MANQGENGKPMIQSSLPSRSRRFRFFLICGNCDVVSVAHNVEKNNTGAQEEKNVIVVSENHSEDKHGTHLERPFQELHEEGEELKSTELQDQDKRHHRAFDHIEHDAKSLGIGKTCCRSDHDGGNSQEKLNGTQQSHRVAEAFLQLHEPDKSKRSRGEDTMQGKGACIRPNLTRQRVVGSVDSLERKGQPVDEPEISTITITENSPNGENQASSTPKVKTDGVAPHSSRVEEEQSTRGSSISRWKRVAALKWKMNKVDVKKIERDAATANEEYEMMLENLTLYGVL